ncbi:cytochrome c oxidase subunit 7, mitochondrial [[Candida] railenensis]|uniref:Cytochrome c oxidase subunit 7, mitochondrial n=1 Tax=[Candida] railenensis TaxID=45579 RepID=A0A9P0QRT8_9ASCO|nr:cytochrome c oxidase subunit 7, mitochondrial [[Candida] railenensis]
MAIDPQRIIDLQREYQNSSKRLWYRGRNGKALVLPFYALFTLTTVVPLYYTGRAIFGIKDE